MVATLNRTLPALAAVVVAVLAAILPAGRGEAQAPQHISVSLIIDNSGSMAATDPANLRFAAARQLVDLLEEGDEIAVVLFADGSTDLVPLTVVTDSASREALKDALAPVTAEGNTDMRAGLEAGLAQLDAASNPVRFGIFLTDGELFPPGWEGFSAAEQEAERGAVFALAEAFREREWGLFPVSLASAVDTDFLQQLADSGGGLYQEAPDPGELTLVFQEVFAAKKLDEFEVLFSDCLAPGEAPSVTFPVHEFVSELSLFVTYTSDVRPQVTVVQPDGEPASPTGGDERYDAYSIAGPQRGIWTIDVVAAAGGESCVSISSTPRSLVEVEWARPESSVQLAPGDPLEISVRLTAAGADSGADAPVEDATVKVTVTGPDGQSSEVVLEHMGAGEYAGSASVEGTGGTYTLALVAETAEGVVARRVLESTVSVLAPAPSPADGDEPPEPAPPVETGGSGGGPPLLLISGGPALLVGLVAVAAAYVHFGRPVLSGWLMAPGELRSVEVGRAYDLGSRHRKVWTRRPLTLGGGGEDINLGLGRRVARIEAGRGGGCFVQATVGGAVTVDGQELAKGQRRRLRHGSKLDLGGVTLVFREHIGGPRLGE